MRAQRIAAKYLDSEDDWRASYHLSAASELPKKGEHWPRLQRLGAQCLEGWRVSTNPLSQAYDPRIETAPAYRLRHVTPMVLETETSHWQTPQISGEPYCVQPFDILVRKVGEVKASLALPRHGQHPADGNLAIIRGLHSEQAVWVCWCINQPLYRAFLEKTDTLSPLIRLGLKRLREMPVARLPEAFKPLARQYAALSEQLAEAYFQLHTLREEVVHTVERWQPEPEQSLDVSSNDHHWRARWFKPADLGDAWLMPYTEQRALARKCLQEYDAYPITSLARINPVIKTEATSKAYVLRIRDLNDNIGIATDLAPIEEFDWRCRNTALQGNDVLVSTIASDSRVAFIDNPKQTIFPSQQLVTLAFHQHQAAWALVMETPFVQNQLASLASGSVQQFIPPHLFERLVLPPIADHLAERWHRHAQRALGKATNASKGLDDLTLPMNKVFEQAHQWTGYPSSKTTRGQLAL